jgi:ABC-type phosphate/phosphonate transport system substrate-binding protein
MISPMGGMWFVLFCAVTSLFSSASENKPDRPDTIHIGIVSSFYRDQPEENVKTTVTSLKDLMLAQTGFKGDPVKVDDLRQLTDKVAKDEMQLGVFHGHEFAWIHKKQPDLKPLLIVVNQIPYQRCYLFVRSLQAASSFRELKGKSIAIARHTPEPCHLFLERQCLEAGAKTEQFFFKITHPGNVEEAMDDVVDGSVDVTVVDEMALISYQRRKPGRIAKLKELVKSSQFPAAVVIYRPGWWQEADLKSIRDALLNAHQNPEGRQLLTMWKLTGFQEVPENYEESLAAINKAYPDPKDLRKPAKN